MPLTLQTLTQAVAAHLGPASVAVLENNVFLAEFAHRVVVNGDSAIQWLKQPGKCYRDDSS